MAGDSIPPSTVEAWPRFAEFRRAYDAVLAQWPTPVQEVDVPSPYGTTHVNVGGAPDGDPLVLLPGGGATSTVWFANVGAWARTHRVYAVDPIGEPGLSRNDGRTLRTRADLMDWLDGLLDGLGLPDTALGGHSYGAWIALSYALHAPARVRRLALLDPTDCFAGLRLGYRLRAIPLFVRPRAQRMRALLHWETAGAPVDPAWLDLVCLGVEFPRARIVLPQRPTAEELRTMRTPTLILLAERSRAHDVTTVAAKASDLLPPVKIETLAGQTHHTIPTQRPEQLNEALATFLA
jgi:pimeloyl-ACP methyl ester carboxylesterase